MIVVDFGGDIASIESGRWLSNNLALQDLLRSSVDETTRRIIYSPHFDLEIAQEMARQLGGEITHADKVSHEVPKDATP